MTKDKFAEKVKNILVNWLYPENSKDAIIFTDNIAINQIVAEITDLESEIAKENRIKCAICNDAGYLKINNKSVVCPCQAQAEIAKEKENIESHVYLIHKDGDTTKLYRDGVKVSPVEFAEFYGCEMTPEQKELLRITKESYFNLLKDEPKVTAEEWFDNHFDCYADTWVDNYDTEPPTKVEGQVIPALTLGAFLDFANQFKK